MFVPSFQIESIRFYRVPTDYRHAILDGLGGDQLRKLTLYVCGDVDPLADLLPNKRLENLAIQRCTLIPIVNSAEFAERVPRAVLADCANQFLPQLKELVTTVTCLGYWSRLFECHRPNLIELDLSCSHIGLRSVSQFDWSDAPNLWPNLEILKFYCNESESTANALKSIAPHLSEFQHLRNLAIPTVIRTNGGVVLSPLDFLARTGHPLPIGLCVRIVSSRRPSRCLYHQS